MNAGSKRRPRSGPRFCGMSGSQTGFTDESVGAEGGGDREGEREREGERDYLVMIPSVFAPVPRVMSITCMTVP